MSKVAQGKVTKASKTKYGYFVQLNGQDFYYNTKYKPKYGEGAEVKLKYEPKGESRGNIVATKVISDPAGGYDNANSESSNSGGGRGGSRGGYSRGGDDRQDSIIMQCAQKVATPFLALLLERGAVVVKGSPDEIRTQLTEVRRELEAEFYRAAKDPLNSPALKTADSIDKDFDDDFDDAPSTDDGWDDDSGSDW